MTNPNLRPHPRQPRSHDAGAAASPHLSQTAALLERVELLGERSMAFNANDERKLVLMEALVHAVLHLAEVVDIRETIAREQ